MVTLTQGKKYYNTQTGVAEGTVEYDTKTGEKLRKGQTTELLPAEPPSNAGNVNNGVPKMKIDPKSPAISNTSTSSAYVAGQKADLLAQERAEEQAAAYKKAVEPSKKSYLDKLLGAKEEIQDAREDATDDSGLIESLSKKRTTQAEFASLESSYASKDAERQKAINQIQDNKGGLLSGAVDEEVARVNRNYAVELNMLSSQMNAKAGYLKALEGDIQGAYEFIDRAVDDATAMQKFEIDAYKSIYEDNKDVFQYLDKTYQSAYDFKLSELEKEYDQARTLERMRLEDSLEDAAGGGSEINKSIREDATQLIYNQGLSKEKAYEQLRLLYGPDEISDAELQSILGIAAAGGAVDENGMPITEDVGTVAGAGSSRRARFLLPGENYEGQYVRGGLISKDEYNKQKSAWEQRRTSRKQRQTERASVTPLGLNQQQLEAELENFLFGK